ncbi:hypothetical protein ACQ4PT_050545 [Festuca glaucescens]
MAMATARGRFPLPRACGVDLFCAQFISKGESYPPFSRNKKHGSDQLGVRKMPNASERARNRASPLNVIRLYDHLSADQKKAIEDMDLGTMLDIKCHVLHNPLINWLARLLHEELCTGKPSGCCLFHVQLLYVDSLDISSLNLDLQDSPFVVNIWSKKDVDTVLDADLKRDGSGYGNLELKPHLAVNFNLFGGAASFERWIEMNTAPNCPKHRQDKFARLMGEFASGITGLMSKLVQGWTEVEVEDNEHVDTAKTAERVRAEIGVCPLSDAGGAANTMSPKAQATDGRPAQILRKSPIRRLKNVPCNQSAEATDFGGSGTAAPLNVLDSMSSPVIGEQTNVVAEVPVVEQTRVTRSAAKAASAANVPGQVDKVPVVNFSDNIHPVDVREKADIMVSECGVVPSQTTFSGVATDVPGVSAELGCSAIAMHIDGAVAEPSEADAIVRVMETDSTIPPLGNRIEFQGLENLAKTVAMHINGGVAEPDSANGNQTFIAEKNDDDVVGANYLRVDATVSTVGLKSGEILSSSFAGAVTNEDNGRGFSNGYDAASATINDVVNQLKRSSSAFDASEAKRSCVAGEDRSVNPEQNVPSCPPKKKSNIRVKDRLQGSTKILSAGTSTVVATDSQISVDGDSDEVALNDVVVPFKSTSQIVAIENGSPHEEPFEASFAPPDFAVDVAPDVEQNATTVSQGNSDGHHSIIPIVVVKESETANVSSIPPTG